MSLINNSNSHEPEHDLDKGYFQCYKSLVKMFIGLPVLGMIQLIFACTQSLGAKTIPVLGCLIDVIFLATMIFQLSAIDDRDLTKAKLALIGFIFSLVVSPVYSFGASYVILGKIDRNIAIQASVALVIIFGFALN